MFKRKGFTLVELLAVIVLLGIIGAIATPTINKIINSSKEKALIAAEKLIISAAKSWASINPKELPKRGVKLVEIQSLIDDNYIENDDIEKITNEEYTTMCVKIRSNSKYSSYDYEITDCQDNLNEDCFIYETKEENGHHYSEITGYYFDDPLVCKMDVLIPPMLGGYEVEKIAVDAFYDETHTNLITSVDFSLSTSINYIGKGSFADNNISVLDLSMLNDLELIDEAAFANNNITSIIFNDNIKKIETAAFAYNNLGNISLPLNIEYLGIGVFFDNLLAGTLDLTSYTKLTTLGEFSPTTDFFYLGTFGYNMITSVVLPNNILYIGDGAFSENLITSINIPSNVIKIGQGSFYDNLINSNLVFPSSLVDIGVYAFDYSINGAVVDFSSTTSLVNIKQGAFIHNSFAPNSVIDFSNSVNLETIGTSAFNSTSNISTINFSGLVKLKSIGLGAFYNTGVGGTIDLSNSTQLEHLGEDSPTGVYYGPFQGNLITTVILPDVPYQMHDAVFRNNRIASINFGTKVTKIGTYAMATNYLTSVSVPGSVTTLFDYSFAGNRLTSATVNSGTTSILTRAFYKTASSNQNLVTINNLTGRSLNWSSITAKGTTATCTFITGTCVDVVIN